MVVVSSLKFNRLETTAERVHEDDGRITLPTFKVVALCSSVPVTLMTAMSVT